MPFTETAIFKRLKFTFEIRGSSMRLGDLSRGMSNIFLIMLPRKTPSVRRRRRFQLFPDGGIPMSPIVLVSIWLFIEFERVEVGNEATPESTESGLEISLVGFL